MKSRKEVLTLFVAGITVLLISALITLRGQNQQNQNDPAALARDQYDESSYPVTNLSTPEPTDPERRARRRARSQSLNPRLRPGTDPSRYRITEHSESSFGIVPPHAPPRSALPFAESAAIVIGEVTDAQSFLTENQIDVYSEFTIHLSEVLKNNSPVGLSCGDTLPVTRSGGAVRLPSGKVIRFGFYGMPLPRVGHRYLFFLRYFEEGEVFSIHTAYELRAGRVIPLDGLYPNGQVIPQFAAHQSYGGRDEATFLNEVRQGIAR